MKRKASSVLLAAVFLIVLFSPHMMWPLLSTQMGENIEKRTLAEKPVFSLQKIEAYPKAYEAYYNDHLPFRDALIKLYNSMLVHVFHTSSSKDVILGKDGWLFYKSKIDGTSLECYDGSMLFTDEELEYIAANLTDAKRQLAERGTEFIVYIAPSKERIYSEYMPDYLGEPAQICMLDQVISYLRSHTDVKVICPLEEIMNYKQEHPQQYLYYQTDTHWNDLGAYIGAKVLLRELGIEIPALDQLETVSLPAGWCDLTSLLNVWNMEEHGAATVIYGEDLREPESVPYEYNGRIEFENQGVSQKRFFMHQDSFGAMMAPYIKPHFSHSLMINNIDYDPEQMWADDPDVYVLEVTERYVRRLRNRIL